MKRCTETAKMDRWMKRFGETAKMDGWMDAKVY